MNAASELVESYGWFRVTESLSERLNERDSQRGTLFLDHHMVGNELGGTADKGLHTELASTGLVSVYIYISNSSMSGWRGTATCIATTAPAKHYVRIVRISTEQLN